jgi:hypothetical protein
MFQYISLILQRLYNPLGAIMAMFAVQLPVIGRKWSLVIGAALQGVGMLYRRQLVCWVSCLAADHKFHRAELIGTYFLDIQARWVKRRSRIHCDIYRILC